MEKDIQKSIPEFLARMKGLYLACKIQEPKESK